MKKSKTILAGALLGMSSLAGGVLVCAQAYSVDWYTIDGGGGTSTGGVYSVSGTIGQPDAGAVLSGGGYTLQGGFWGILAVQTAGAPWLNIVSSGTGQATVSWDSDDPVWHLQEATSLVLSNWVDSASGSMNPVTIPASGGPKFFRLLKR